jgi:N-acetylmuramoyl-L-alanine amidase
MFCFSDPRAAAQKLSAHPIICVDPGHPSEINDGLQKQNGTSETVVNWQIALRLRPLLERDGYHVVMTKKSLLEKVTNTHRAEIANQAGARLTLRLHCDAGSGTGYRIFYPAAAGRHGKVVGPGPGIIAKSHVAAKAVHAGLAEGLGGDLRDNGIAGDAKTAVGKKQGALIGSIHSKVPTVLVEMVFLNNKNDAAYIQTEEGQRKMAEALAAGIRRYVPIPGQSRVRH